jgi:hypothetical protein
MLVNATDPRIGRQTSVLPPDSVISRAHHALSADSNAEGGAYLDDAALYLLFRRACRLLMSQLR